MTDTRTDAADLASDAAASTAAGPGAADAAGADGIHRFHRLWERPPEPKRRLSPAQSGLVIVLGAFGAMDLSMLWLLFADGVLSALPFIHRQLTQFNQSMASVDSGSYLWSFLTH